MMDCVHENRHIIVNCGERLTLENIQHQKEILIDVFNSDKPIIFDAHDLDIIDTASLQLVLSFILTASRQGIKCEWRDPSPSLKHLSKLLGMQELLMILE